MGRKDYRSRGKSRYEGLQAEGKVGGVDEKQKGKSMNRTTSRSESGWEGLYCIL